MCGLGDCYFQVNNLIVPVGYSRQKWDITELFYSLIPLQRRCMSDIIFLISVFLAWYSGLSRFPNIGLFYNISLSSCLQNYHRAWARTMLSCVYSVVVCLRCGLFSPLSFRVYNVALFLQAVGVQLALFNIDNCKNSVLHLIIIIKLEIWSIPIV